MNSTEPAQMTPPENRGPVATRSVTKKAIAAVVLIGLMLLVVFILFIYQDYSGMQRFYCAENLKLISYSLHSHNEYQGYFPTTTQTGSAPPIGWRVELWTKVRFEKLSKYDLTAPHDSPQNMALAAQITDFRCSLSSTREGNTSYFAVFSNAEAEQQTCFVMNQRLRAEDITDGYSNTIFAVEASRHSPQVLWHAAGDLHFNSMDFTVNNKELRPGIAGLHDGFWHPTVAPVAAADNSVIFLSNEIDPEVLRKLLLRNDGQPVEFPRSR